MEKKVLNFYLEEESKKVSDKWKMLGFLNEEENQKQDFIKKKSFIQKNSFGISDLKSLFNDK